MASPNSVDFKLYRYTPSTSAAAVFVALFSLMTLCHLFQLLRSRSWYFLSFLTGGIFEIIGYVCRILAHNNKESVPIYSVMTILILLAPPLFAVSIYMVLSRLIIHLRAEELSAVSVKWMPKIFVVGDVVGFVAQAAGGGIMASGSVSSYNLGEHITVAGLAVQLLFFAIFMVTCALFHYRLRRCPTAKVIQVKSDKNGKAFRTWESLLVGLYISSLLILVRSVFRLIEFAQGNDGYLISHEVFLYVFDATLMFLAMAAMAAFHPSSILIDSREDQPGAELLTRSA
ncbi:hypothetical protein PMG11_11322 [Penicillium brasilianum]|uniref:RTA1 domain protein n=1 Tax=Penicillium brasilianum TaxID=104259 RepID=A0A0F7U3I1_PENBI|nr:hypothetical protein PMG11_11322 [Penicillium brasilianum]